jgi:hypothetical protein
VFRTFADGEKTRRSYTRRGSRDRRTPTGRIHAATADEPLTRAASPSPTSASSAEAGSPSNTSRPAAAVRTATTSPAGRSGDEESRGVAHRRRSSETGRTRTGYAAFWARRSRCGRCEVRGGGGLHGPDLKNRPLCRRSPFRRARVPLWRRIPRSRGVLGGKPRRSSQAVGREPQARRGGSRGTGICSRSVAQDSRTVLTRASLWPQTC